MTTLPTTAWNDSNDYTSVEEACETKGLNWDVVQLPLTATSPSGREMIAPKVLNIRSDTEEVLGVVSDGYVPIQNKELAEFGQMLADSNKAVRCETAGAVRNGQQVYILLQGESFSLSDNDEISPYILLTNSHDGSASIRVTPTTTRLWCANQLPSIRRNSVDALTCRHTRRVKERMEQAVRAFEYFREKIDAIKSTAAALKTREVSVDEVNQFFVECYTEQFGEIPSRPTKKVEQNRRDRAKVAWAHFTNRFESEREVAGTSAWNAFNAWSGMVQHDFEAKGKTSAQRRENRVFDNLFGKGQRRTIGAWERALKLIG